MYMDSMEEAVEYLSNAKRVIVIAGAGISVAAGFDTFRGEDGSHKTKFEDMNIKDLMSASVFRNSAVLGVHRKFIGSWIQKAYYAQPTTFHRLLKLLDDKSVLKRIYTQNIDGLEAKVGFELADSSLSPPTCILLHGSLLRLRCTKCTSKEWAENYVQDLKLGHPTACNVCEKRNVWKAAAGQRETSPGFLRPDIVLYDEETPDEEVIRQAEEEDTQDIGKGDVLLVAGTSLQIPGLRTLYKRLAQIVTKKEGHVIHVNIVTNPAEKGSIFVTQDCQLFADAAIDALGGIRALESTLQMAVGEDYKNVTGRRRDPRPLWSWSV